TDGGRILSCAGRRSASPARPGVRLWVPFRSLERGWRRGATRSSYRGRDQAGATDVILDIKRLLLSPGNTSILPENIVGQSLSVGFRPLPQTTPLSAISRETPSQHLPIVGTPQRA